MKMRRLKIQMLTCDFFSQLVFQQCMFCQQLSHMKLSDHYKLHVNIKCKQGGLDHINILVCWWFGQEKDHLFFIIITVKTALTNQIWFQLVQKWKITAFNCQLSNLSLEMNMLLISMSNCTYPPNLVPIALKMKNNGF